MKRILLAFLLFASTARAAAPDAELDSLRDRLRQRIALHRRTPDDSLANACADLAEYWCYRSNDSSRFYAEKGLAANGGERGITALRLLNDLGVTALNDGDVRKAERLFREAAAAGERLAFDEGLIAVYSALGVALRRQDRTDEALEYYRKGLICAERSRDDASAANLYGNIAVLYSALGRYGETVEYARRGTAAAVRCGDFEQELYNRSVEASALIHLDRLDEGIGVLRRSFRRAQKLGTPKLALKCLAPLVSGFDRQGRRDSVARYLAVGEKLLPQVSERSVEALGFLELQGNLLSRYGRHAESLAIRRRLLALQRENAHTPTPTLLRAIAGDRAGLGQYEEAFEALSESCRIQDSLTAHGIQQQLSDLTVKYRPQEKELEIARLEGQALAQKNGMMRKTIWFTGCSLALGLVLLVVYLRYRRTQHRARRLEEERRRQKREYDDFRKQVDLQLARNYIGGLENERARMAKELHDGICNDLFGMELHLGELLPDDPNRIRTLALLRRMREEVRTMSHTLMPPRFQHASVDEILAEFAARLGQTHGTTVEYASDAATDWSSLPDEVGYELYRIVQETVGNAVKHAAAHRIDIALSDTGREYLLTVRDDGHGMDPAHGGRGIGTRTVADRVRSIGGTLRIVSDTSGTTVEVRIPH